MKQNSYLPLYSPIHAKPIFYRTNGGGRDTYIDFNNGGLTANKPFSVFPEIGTFSSNNNHRFSHYGSKKPNLGQKTQFYRANGSGRDTYMLQQVYYIYIDYSQATPESVVYFTNRGDILSPQKVSQPNQISSDRTNNFFVGQLRSYQVPQFTDSTRNRQRLNMVKKILLKKSMLAKSQSEKLLKEKEGLQNGELVNYNQIKLKTVTKISDLLKNEEIANSINKNSPPDMQRSQSQFLTSPIAIAAKTDIFMQSQRSFHNSPQQYAKIRQTAMKQTELTRRLAVPKQTTSSFGQEGIIMRRSQSEMKVRDSHKI